jgi:hypothetical protein
MRVAAGGLIASAKEQPPPSPSMHGVDPAGRSGEAQRTYGVDPARAGLKSGALRMQQRDAIHTSEVADTLSADHVLCPGRTDRRAEARIPPHRRTRHS